MFLHSSYRTSNEASVWADSTGINFYFGQKGAIFMFCSAQNASLKLTRNRISVIKYKIRQLTDNPDSAKSSILVVQLILNFYASLELESSLSS